MPDYVYQPDRTLTDFDEAADLLSARLGRPVLRRWVDHTNPEGVRTVERTLRGLGVRTMPQTVDASQWRDFVDRAGYRTRYPDYYAFNWIEKSFEHMVALDALQLGPGEVFIDVASEGSPLPEIATRLTGCRSFAQDIMYEPGLTETRIGGDATAMPVPDDFADGVCLTCSLEHFEEDADTRLFTELARVLKPGGRAVIVPLYLAPKPAVQTDPIVSATLDIQFDEAATIFCAQRWGNRHARFYSPDTLAHRIIGAHSYFFEFAVHSLVGAAEVDPSIYARFLLIARRR